MIIIRREDVSRLFSNKPCRPTTHSTRRLDSVALMLIFTMPVQWLRSARVNSGVMPLSLIKLACFENKLFGFNYLLKCLYHVLHGA